MGGVGILHAYHEETAKLFLGRRIGFERHRRAEVVAWRVKAEIARRREQGATGKGRRGPGQVGGRRVNVQGTLRTRSVDDGARSGLKRQAGTRGSCDRQRDQDVQRTAADKLVPVGRLWVGESVLRALRPGEKQRTRSLVTLSH